MAEDVRAPSATGMMTSAFGDVEAAETAEIVIRSLPLSTSAPAGRSGGVAGFHAAAADENASDLDGEGGVDDDEEEDAASLSSADGWASSEDEEEDEEGDLLSVASHSSEDELGTINAVEGVVKTGEDDGQELASKVIIPLKHARLNHRLQM
jgi:hypothetical protein